MLEVIREELCSYVELQNSWRLHFLPLSFGFTAPFHIHLRPSHQLVDDDPGSRFLLVLGPRDLDELLLPLGFGYVFHLGQVAGLDPGLLARRLGLGLRLGLRRWLTRLGGLARCGFLRGHGAPSDIGAAWSMLAICGAFLAYRNQLPSRATMPP